jgi:hypothetical protein
MNIAYFLEEKIRLTVRCVQIPQHSKLPAGYWENSIRKMKTGKFDSEKLENIEKMKRRKYYHFKNCIRCYEAETNVSSSS